jgi:hypothetical protein
MNARRKGSTTAAVLGVLGVLVVGGAIWYFASDPFHTRVNEAWKQGTQWTPEQIAKDPVNYLNFCEEETTKAMDKLKASRIAVAQNRASLESMQKDARNQVDVGKKAMLELLGSYKTADAANTWPVSWQGKTFDKDAVKVQVVALNKQVAAKEALLTKVDNGLKQLDAQVGKIGEAEANAQTQLAEIKANKELLKVQALSDDIKNKLVSMQSAVAATVNTASETSSTISLDQLAATSAQTADNTEFDKILTNNTK